MKLNLGVLDVPYDYSKDGKTTGDVAEILEGKYHIFEHFAQMHGEDISKALEASVQGAFESMLMGAPPRNDLYGAGTDAIEQTFRKFLSGAEMDALGYPGIPTEAAKRGVSHRFKHPYARRPSRPSFEDTGLLEASMRAWIDD